MIASLLRRVRPVWVDLGLTVAVVAVQLWPFLTRTSHSGQPWQGWGYAVVVASAVPVLWHRRAPVAALLTSLLATSLYDLVEVAPDQPIWYGGLIAGYGVAARSTRPVRVAMLVATVVGAVLISSSETTLRVAVLFVAVYALGRASAEARDRATRLERERELEAERAAERERARIARDMHDILSHAVSVMVVQAEAGPVMLAKSPARAEAAFDAIASAGRDAMTQLRRILDVLHTGERPHAPQPTLDDLPSLVANGGVPTAYTVTGVPSAVPPDVEVAVYRITQEAMTNIIKHASATAATVLLTWEDDALALDITDDGRGGRGTEGRGLIGIRERAAACGGTATTGPLTTGGFHVGARFPLR